MSRYITRGVNAFAVSLANAVLMLLASPAYLRSFKRLQADGLRYRRDILRNGACSPEVTAKVRWLTSEINRLDPGSKS